MHSMGNGRISDRTHPSVMDPVFMANEWAYTATGMVTAAHIKDKSHQIWLFLAGYGMLYKGG